MKLEFDVKISEKDLYSFNLRQAYKGSQGVVSILIFLSLAVAAGVYISKGQYLYATVYGAIGVVLLLYVPLSLKGRVKLAFKTNKTFLKPLHFEVDEKAFVVSQDEEKSELPWEMVYKYIASKDDIYVFSNRQNAYILSKSQLGDNFEKLNELAKKVLESYRVKIK